MMKQRYLKSIIYIGIITIASLVALVSNSFFPDIMFPSISIPMFVLFAALAQMLAYYLKIDDEGCPFVSALFASIASVVLPLLARFDLRHSAWIMLLVSYAVYLAIDFIYSSMADRMKSGPKAILAPAVNCLLLFLASEAFMGLL